MSNRGAELAALELAEQWVKVDSFYEDKFLTERERALMHLAIRCYAEPIFVHSELRLTSREDEDG